MTKVLMVAATLVFALSLAAPVDASCVALARIRTTNAGGQTSFITNTAFQDFPVIAGVTYAGTGPYGPYTFSYDPLIPAIPPVSAAANISFWRQGTGNPAVGLGDDNGVYDMIATGGFYFTGYPPGDPSFPGGYLGGGRLNGTWQPAGIDGCVGANSCMCLLISDQDGANGDWAILGGMSNANFDSFLDLGGTDGVSNLAPIEMVPIPAPSVSNISAIPSGFGFSASVVLSGGNFVQGDCECLTGGGFRIVAASVPLGSQPPQSRDSANWTHPVTLAGGAAQSSPSAFGSTVDFEIGCLAGNQQVYVAAELAFDSGFRAVHVSADAVGPGLQPLNCPPCPIDTDMDGFCDPGDNCPQDYNPHQSDFDLDGEGDLCDLNDGLIYIVGSSPIRIEWQEEGFTRWNSYRGDMEYLRNTGIYTQDLGLVPLARRECRLMDPWLDDTDLLPVGKVVFYLTTGVVGGSETDLGTDSFGAVRPNDNACP